MTPEEIEGLRKLLATYPEEDRLIFARAAAEFLRLHDATITGVQKMANSLEQANPDEPAWVTRFAKGKADCSPFVAKEIADQVRELLIYRRAIQAMAEQFIHPKTTAKELAEQILRGRS